MMGRKFAFRVNWQFGWKQCSVLACLDNKTMVDTIEGELQHDQVKPTNTGSVTMKDTQDS
ncbi:hypothetical protein L195_g059903 [Trifolium pratense]|uniref:Uncharacterized protein n=1 Tax=Trifolium pratense TaxID=57577 RepID=A0A2K3K0N9_TRIPR|nr:hypothetical protein L195_g059903 [Trifolium pratense]